MNIKLILIFIIVGLLCFGVGYIFGYGNGYASAMNWAVEFGLKLLKEQGVEVSMDSKMITLGIMQYKDRIGGCLFNQNVSIDYPKYT